MAVVQRITPFLWFDNEAEPAARLYTSLFPNSRITDLQRYTPEGAQAAGRPEGSVMIVAYELDGQKFTAINGGPVFKFNEAISLVVHCASQDEIDHYWNGLSEGGDPNAQQCGWLKDPYGLSWQVVPAELGELMSANARDVMAAILQMKKIDLATLRRAAGR